MLIIYALFALTLLAYLILSTAQLRAIAAGLRARDFTPIRAWTFALMLAYVPIIGSAAGVYGATAGWNWTVQKGVFRFFGPLLIIGATYLWPKPERHNFIDRGQETAQDCRQLRGPAPCAACDP